ncbi:MAG: hypothetical protein QXN71_01505 [Candidatus Aenigmatarchaeota archaeon]
MGKFVLGKSFVNQKDGIKRHNISVIETNIGKFFAYQVEFLGEPEHKRYKTVCFPYIRELEPEDGFRAIEIGDYVPLEKREDVSEILRKEGYKGEIKW